jgi:hypothetical protein
MGARPPIPARAGAACGLGLIALLGAISRSHAQPANLSPVDQGVADVGPLSASSRVVPRDLRVPSGFDRVYRFGTGGAGGEKYARISGGITAVFPRSQYVPTRDGYEVQTPAGTVYYIGRLPGSVLETADALAAERMLPRPGFDDRSARRAVLDRPRAPARADPPPRPAQAVTSAALRPAAPAPISKPTLFTDEPYRARRVAELLDQASVATAASR